MSRPTISIYGIQDSGAPHVIAYSHSHSITVMQDGNVLKHLTLERHSRKKYDNGMPSAIIQLLRDEKLLNLEADYIFSDNVLGRAFISTNGKLRFEAPLSQKLSNGIEKGRMWKFDHWEKAYALNHELAHIYSCIPFWGHFKENSLLVHFDGGASQSNFSAWHYHNGNIKNLVASWDLKPFSSIYNANALSFAIIGAGLKDQHSVAGKLMGYASYGKPNPKIETWLKKNHFFQDYWGKKAIMLAEINSFFGSHLKSFDQHTQEIKNIAATLQLIWQNKLFETIQRYAKLTSAKNLYYTGGAALNIKANASLEKHLNVRNIYIPPCTDDSGLSLGAAVALEIQKGNAIALHSPFINNWGLELSNSLISTADIKKVAKCIYQGQIIGICNGFAEVGPRALGHRSIICRADRKALAQKVSKECKGREWYRPVAPLVLESNLTLFTEKQNTPLSTYMLTEFPIKASAKHLLEGANHVDNTARFQIIKNDHNSHFLFSVLTELSNNYQIFSVINTSFNIKGEPIVHTKKEAIQSAIKMGLDALVLQGHLYTSNELLALCSE